MTWDRMSRLPAAGTIRPEHVAEQFEIPIEVARELLRRAVARQHDHPHHSLEEILVSVVDCYHRPGQASRHRAPGKTTSLHEYAARPSGVDARPVADNDASAVDSADRVAAAPTFADLGFLNDPSHPAAFGLAAGEVPVRVDEVARARTQRHEAAGLFADNVIYIDPDHWRPKTTGGRALLGHELAHAAQAKLPRPSGGYDIAAAEAEADVLGQRFAAGATMARPRYALRPGHAAAKKKHAGASTSKTLPPGVNFEVQGTVIVVRRSWLGTDNELSQTGVSLPGKYRELLTALRGQFPWARDADIADAATRIKIDRIPDGAFVELYLESTVLDAVGLPPGVDVYWRLEGTGARLHLRGSAIGGKPGQLITLKPALVATIWDKLVEFVEPKDTNFGTRSFADQLAESRAAFVAKSWQLTRTASPSQSHKATRWDMGSFIGVIQWESKLGAGGSDTSGKQGPLVSSEHRGLRFASELTMEDREAYWSWLQRIQPGQVPVQGPGERVLPQTILMLRSIDSAAHRGYIVIELRRLKLRANHMDPEIIRRAHARGVRRALRVDAPGTTTKRPRHPRPFPFTVHAPERAWAGKKSQFTIETGIEALGKTGWLELPNIVIRWAAHPKGDQSKAQTGRTNGGYVGDAAVRRFRIPFQDTGTYVVHAFVTHEHYYEGHAQVEVVVSSRRGRLLGLESEAFAGTGYRGQQGAQHNPRFPFHFSKGVLDSADDVQGEAFAYDAPPGYSAPTLEQRLSFIDRDNLLHLIEAHKDKSDGRSKAIVAYARGYLKRLQEPMKELYADRDDGWTVIDSRGAFQSDNSEHRDGVLQLVTMAKRDKGQVHVSIRDFSMLYEPKVGTFEGSSKRSRPQRDQAFQDAVLSAFHELCKSYPPGKMSAVFQRFQGSRPELKKQMVGFSLSTGSGWKRLKKKVWDPTVQLAVNIAGTALMVFVPPAGAIVFPALVAYNATNVVDNLVELEAKGQLTARAFAQGISEIGLELLPVIARARVVGTLRGVTRWAVPGVEMLGGAVLLTTHAKNSIVQIRDQYIVRIARLNIKYRALKASNPWDPALPRLEGEIESLVTEARHAAKDVWGQTLSNYGAIVVPTATATRIAAGMRNRPLGELASQGVFHHKKGVAPRYEADTGRIIGDRKQLSADKLEELQRRYLADMANKRAELANVLGVLPGELVIKRVKREGAAKVTSKGDKVVVEVPGSRRYDAVKDDVVRHHVSGAGQGLSDTGRAGGVNAPRNKHGPYPDDPTPHARRNTGIPYADPSGQPAMPRRYRERRELAPVRRLSLHKDWTSAAKVLKKKNGVAIGRKLRTADEGHEILAQLARGDADALHKLGIEDYPGDLDTTGREWGLVQARDGYVVYAGKYNAIAIPTKLRVIAHTHPGTKPSAGYAPGGRQKPATDLDDAGGAGRTYAEIIDDWKAAGNAGITPSAPDIHAITDGAAHVIHTRYVHLGGGKIANPTAGGSGSQVALHLSGTRVVRWRPRQREFVYEVDVRVVDAKGDTLWEGKMHATWAASLKEGAMYSGKVDADKWPSSNGWEAL